jgi:hypothetical protein
MKSPLRFLVLASVCTCVLVIALLLTTPAKAGNGAVVTDEFCFFVTFDPVFGGYSGDCTVVHTPSGNINAECDADLLFGDPAGEATRLTGGNVFFSESGSLPCEVELTPSGKANVSCHDHE